MSIVVTGATGQLGQLIIPALIAHGAAAESIVAAGRNTEVLESLASAHGVRTARVDYTDTASIAAALEGATKVLLISGTEPDRVQQHKNVIDAAAKIGSTVIYTSAPRVDVSELIVASDHFESEKILQTSGVPYTILRHNWYFENYADTIKGIAASGVLETTFGEGTVAAATRADYAEGDAIVLLSDDHVGRTLEFSGSTAFTADDLGAAVGDVAGREVTVVQVTPEQQAETLRGFGLDDAIVTIVVTIDGNIRDGWLGKVDDSLEQVIGRPTTPLRDAVATILAS